MKPVLVIYAVVFVLLFSITACSRPEDQKLIESSPAASSTPGTIDVDLSSPPPGSNATQEKWDTFTDEKKQESWNNFMSENAAVSDITSEPVSTETAPEIKRPGGGGGGSSVIPVVVGKLTSAEIDLYYYGLGEIAAGNEIQVNPGSSGTVESLYVSEGDFVEIGDLLFSLDNNNLVNNIERSSEKWDNDLELAQIKLNEAEASYEVASRLYPKGLISRVESEKAQQTWEEAKLNYNNIQLAKTTDIENLQENLESTVAISPGRGYISEISFGINEQIGPGDYVEIIDIENIVIVVRVPQNIITRIKNGSRVVAKQASAPAYILEGNVTSVGLKADVNGTYVVTAEFDNPNQRLLPGMLIEAQIQMVRYSNNLVVPKSSVITDGDQSFIFRVVEGKAERIPVETGQSKGSLIQIMGLVKSEDLIVLSGQSYLQKGSTVNIVEQRNYLPERTEF
jgi:RND family efflux transporter MFP subunit